MILDEDIESGTLSEWLYEIYSEGDKVAHFSEADLNTLGALLQSMMRYRPSDRPRASDLLLHPWFQDDPFAVE